MAIEKKDILAAIKNIRIKLKKDDRADLFNKISYPGTYLYGTNLNEATIRSIISKQYFFLGKLKEIISLDRKLACYDSDYASYCSLYNCWRGVEYFLDRNRSWDLCMGVNNPYLMSSALIKDKFKCYAITITTYSENGNIHTVHEYSDKKSAIEGKKELKTKNPIYAIHYLPDGTND